MRVIDSVQLTLSDWKLYCLLDTAEREREREFIIVHLIYVCMYPDRTSLQNSKSVELSKVALAFGSIILRWYHLLAKEKHAIQFYVYGVWWCVYWSMVYVWHAGRFYLSNIVQISRRFIMTCMIHGKNMKFFGPFFSSFARKAIHSEATFFGQSKSVFFSVTVYVSMYCTLNMCPKLYKSSYPHSYVHG